MRKFNALYASLLVSIFVRLALLCIPGCQSPEGLAGSANSITHKQTVKLADQVNKAQVANTSADTEVVAALNNPRVPDDVKAGLRKAHGFNQTVQDSLKPIGIVIIPSINRAADDALRAEIAAQAARNTKITYTIALLVFAGVTLGLRTQSGFGWAVSCVAGGIAALVVGLVVGEIAKWMPWILGIATAGAVVYFIEKEMKGGWLAALHDRWHTIAGDVDGAAQKYLPSPIAASVTRVIPLGGNPGAQ